MEIRSRFKQFGGRNIPDIIEYLKEYIKSDPNVTISLGCDSIQKRRKTMYAITIMLYNGDVKNGAHLVFFRESFTKVKDNFERLQKEAEFLHEIGEFLNVELSPFYSRGDLSEMAMKKYKYHLLKCAGEYSNVAIHDDDTVCKNLFLTTSDLSIDFKLIDLHIDFNPFEGIAGKNKSNLSYKSYVPWLRGMGYRVWAKPMSFAASSASDLLVQD